MHKAPEARHVMQRHTLFFILVTLMAVAIAGCGSAGGTGSQPQSSKDDGQRQTLPAVTEPASTPSPVPPTPTTTTPGSQAAAGTAAWTQYSRTGTDGTRLSYRYPPTWTKDLSYCPNSKNSNQGLGSHLPPGCAGTDFLFGQKVAGVASSIKSSDSKARNAGSMKVVTQVDTPLDTSKASKTYTVLVYNPGGTPVSGFVTYIGPGTSEAETRAILATLDDLASTVALEK